jgi:hypothetical protein
VLCCAVPCAARVCWLAATGWMSCSKQSQLLMSCGQLWQRALYVGTGTSSAAAVAALSLCSCCLLDDTKHGTACCCVPICCLPAGLVCCSLRGVALRSYPRAWSHAIRGAGLRTPSRSSELRQSSTLTPVQCDDEVAAWPVAPLAPLLAVAVRTYGPPLTPPSAS